jgi:2',3'-cyclic-nucleotide 2'-phosphodiesterase (5'-nucleotidase family)
VYNEKKHIEVTDLYKTVLSIMLALVLLAGCVAPPLGSSTPNASCIHTDSDDNGICDGCRGSVIVYIDFYNINDLHGKLADADSHPGVDELSTYFDRAKLSDDHVVLLSTGDMWQGSAESNMTKGKIITDWMNEMDFVSMTLGNHEYDWGESYIRENAEMAEFPFLAINIYNRDTNQPVDYCQPSVMVERGGIQIGIIGAMGDCYSSIAPDHTKEIYFKTGSDLTNLVKAESEKLRQAGADFIVYAIHDGYGRSNNGSQQTVSGGQLGSYYDTTLSDGYVDLVFEGHSHQRYLLKDEHGVYHLQGGGDNDGITHAEIGINSVTGSYVVSDREFLYTSVYESLDDDPVVKELLDKYKELIAPSNRVVGYNAAYRSSDYLRQIIARLYLEAGIDKWGDEYDIVLGGGFLSVRSPYDLEKGDVTYSVLQSIFPFDNQLVLCSVKGKDLLSKFINSNNSNYFIARSDNRTIDPNGTYYIIVDTYTSTYAPNRLTEIERYGADIFARDLLADYIGEGHFE